MLDKNDLAGRWLVGAKAAVAGRGSYSVGYVAPGIAGDAESGLSEKRSIGVSVSFPRPG